MGARAVRRPQPTFCATSPSWAHGSSSGLHSEPWYWTVLLTHLLNVWLLFGVLSALTASVLARLLRRDALGHLSARCRHDRLVLGLRPGDGRDHSPRGARSARTPRCHRRPAADAHGAVSGTRSCSRARRASAPASGWPWSSRWSSSCLLPTAWRQPRRPHRLSRAAGRHAGRLLRAPIALGMDSAPPLFREHASDRGQGRAPRHSTDAAAARRVRGRRSRSRPCLRSAARSSTRERG